MKLLGEFHQPQRLTVTLRMGHTKIAAQLLFRVAAPLVADHYDGVVVQTRPTADDRGVVTVGAIAMKLDEIREGELDVVGGKRPLRIASNLNSLERSQVLVDFFAEVFELALERLDCFGDTELTVARCPLDFVDLPFQLDDRLLELELCC